MLKNQENEYRRKNDLSGLWNLRVDKENIGESEKWFNELKPELDVAVPGSWNEQLEAEGLLNYLGDVWYQKEFFVSKDLSKSNVFIRIDSADYYSKVWINGNYVGDHLGGFLAFEFNITEFVRLNEINQISIKINNQLDSTTIPQGITKEDYENEGRQREETYPSTRFDFFPFGGIQRPVYIYSTPKEFIKDIKAGSKLINEKNAILNIDTEVFCKENSKIKYELIGNGQSFSGVCNVKSDNVEFEINVENCRLWSMDDPYMYILKVQLLDSNNIIDEYKLNVGIREVTFDNKNLYLNGEKIFLKGFGKHEDFPVIGKGLNLPLIVKDFSLLKWINANSFRTSHYPYAEEWLDYADRKGILVIDEVPAVSLDFRKTSEKTLENHKDYIKKLITRDYNHPSVIMWATGNEPNIVGYEDYYDGSGDKYWKELYEFTKSLDNSRPITIPNCQRGGTEDPILKYSDIISLNRYYGWYENPGQLDVGIKRMEKEMDFINKKYDKPIIVTEFGADTVAGLHSISDQQFTEEYQSNLLELYIKLIESKDYTVGEHVWNFADFKTPQHFRRVVDNLKGVFSRIREPKLAAFTLKRLWAKQK